MKKDTNKDFHMGDQNSLVHTEPELATNLQYIILQYLHCRLTATQSGPFSFFCSQRLIETFFKCDKSVVIYFLFFYNQELIGHNPTQKGVPGLWKLLGCLLNCSPPPLSES